MLSDPIRLSLGPAAAATAPPADGGPPLGPDEAAPIAGHTTFDEMLRALNPLHHLPVVGMIYRAITGEEIQPAFRVLGGALFGGGVGGMLSGAALAAVEQFRPAERLLANLRGEPDPLVPSSPPSPEAPDPAQPLILAQARATYGMFGNGAA